MTWHTLNPRVESEKLWGRAQGVIAGGTSHDVWRAVPFPRYIVSANGPIKVDADGNKLIDYWMGHGALLMGHSFAPVVDAVALQLSKGTHFGGTHELEILWAERVNKLIRSAERVRFASSGTEATLLAIRVARAFTGRQCILKFDGHFHGWHDESLGHYFDAITGGLNEAALENMILCNLAELDAAVELIRDGSVAGVILEPGGGSSGALPWSADILTKLRSATKSAGSLLIFDEVVSGFRYHEGGVQGLCGVIPDITVLGKILCGGLPGGAIAGSEPVMSVFGSGKITSSGLTTVKHSGTFNANPLSAAAGIAMLSCVGTGQPQRFAADAASVMTRTVNEIASARHVDVRLFNQSSIFHIMVGAIKCNCSACPSTDVFSLYAKQPKDYQVLRQALLTEGLDTHPLHGWVSAVHDDNIISQSIDAFDRAFAKLSSDPAFCC